MLQCLLKNTLNYSQYGKVISSLSIKHINVEKATHSLKTGLVESAGM